MPSGSGKKSKEDTWNERDLMKAIQGDSKERRHRSSDRTSRSSDSIGTLEEKKKESRHASKSEKAEKERHSRHRMDNSKDLDNEEREKKQRRHKTDENRKHKSSKDREKESHLDLEFKNKESRHINETDKKRKSRKHRVDREGEVEVNVDSKKERRREYPRERDDPRQTEDELEKEKRRKERRKEKEEQKHRKDEGRRKERDLEGEKEKHERRKHRERNREKEYNHGGSEEKIKEGRNKESRHKSREKIMDKDMLEQEKEKKSKMREKEMLKQIAMDSNPDNKVKSIEEKENEENNDYEYEDDFDEYDDDDFEEDNDEEDEEEVIENENARNDESPYSSDSNHKIQAQESMLHLTHIERQGVQEVLKAISDENKIAISQAKSRTRPFTGSTKQNKSSDSVIPPKQSFGKINFIAASQKQINEKAAQKTKQRGQELLQLVQLDVRAMQLFDLPPMTEYELYMKRFGQSDACQTFTQTNDDDQTQETQTDNFTCESKWCQFSHDFKACGSDGDDSLFNMNSSMDGLVSTSSVRLNKFLIKASQVCISLLEELEAGIEQPQRQYTESRSGFSDGYVTLESSNFLVLGRNFCDLAYSMSQTNMLLTAYGESNVMKNGQKSPKGLICVWNTNEPTKPFKLLTCESIPRSCCFNSGKASMAFAGMEDGVIAVWDLREPASYHEHTQMGHHQHIFRTATFTTATLSDNHSFPVVSVMPVTSPYASSADPSRFEIDIDFSFQLASLDESGVVHIWILVEVEVDATDLRNVSDDLGLSAKGRIKLMKSATISPNKTSPTSFAHFFSVNCLQIHPAKPNHVYFGTDQGEIIHMLRFGKRPTPKVFSRRNGGSCVINAIDVSPWRMPYLLAGYDDGTIALFSLNKENPISSWSLFSNGAAIVEVKWSRSKPNIFFAMDDHSVLYLWDLLRADDAPCSQYALKRKDKRATAFSFANDYASLGLGTPGRPAEMAVVYGDGSVEIHRLTKDICHLSGSEMDNMQLYLDGIT